MAYYLKIKDEYAEKAAEEIECEFIEVCGMDQAELAYRPAGGDTQVTLALDRIFEFGTTWEGRSRPWVSGSLAHGKMFVAFFADA